MFKLRRLLPLVFLMICSGTTFSVYAFYFNRSFPCFGTFNPTLAQVEERVDIDFPPSAMNIEWICDPDPFDAFHVYVRFKMSPNDLNRITTATDYHEVNLSDLPYFRDKFDDIHLEREARITLRKDHSSSCGFTNIWIDIHDPGTYIVYAHYHSWTGFFWVVCKNGEETTE